MGGRPKRIAALLFKLLLHPLMQRATSEILISHGSEQAWQARANLTGAVSALANRFDRRRGCEGASRAAARPEVFCDTEHQLRLANYEGNRLVHTGKSVWGSTSVATPGARADTSKLRDCDSRVANAELGGAQRHLAAGHARNEAIVHVDDDALPDAHNLQLISRTFCRLHAEAGFPTCALSSTRPASAPLHAPAPAAHQRIQLSSPSYIQVFRRLAPRVARPDGAVLRPHGLQLTIQSRRGGARDDCAR